jgi:hypothetical protein
LGESLIFHCLVKYFVDFERSSSSSPTCSSTRVV